MSVGETSTPYSGFRWFLYIPYRHALAIHCNDLFFYPRQVLLMLFNYKRLVFAVTVSWYRQFRFPQFADHCFLAVSVAAVRCLLFFALVLEHPRVVSISASIISCRVSPNRSFSHCGYVLCGFHVPLFDQFSDLLFAQQSHAFVPLFHFLSLGRVLSKSQTILYYYPPLLS